jgi:urea transporter
MVKKKLFKCSKTRPRVVFLGSLVSVLVAAMIREIARGRALEPESLP